MSTGTPVPDTLTNARPAMQENGMFRYLRVASLVLLVAATLISVGCHGRRELTPAYLADVSTTPEVVTVVATEEIIVSPDAPAAEPMPAPTASPAPT